jgi:hypothetical protein
MITARKMLLALIVLFACACVVQLYAQDNNSGSITVISAKDLYEGLKNKTLNFDYNQRIVITGVLKDTGSSFIYNSSYLLISDSDSGYIYVKAVLSDKNKRSEYTSGQNIKINSRFYEERDKVVVVKDSKNID